MARIALDAMGGDFAPQATVAGALLALAELDPAHTHPARRQHRRHRGAARRAPRRRAVGASPAHRDRLEIVEAPDVIEMTDKPSAAIRGKPNSSMVVGLRLQAEGSSDAFVSAGNTGAQMAASMRPARAARGPHAPGHRHALPDGAPAGRRARLGRQRRLLRRGARAVRAARRRLRRVTCSAAPNPAVGLLSIGEEPEKGNAVVKEAHQLLQALGRQLHRQRRGARPPRRRERPRHRRRRRLRRLRRQRACSSSTRRSRRCIDRARCARRGRRARAAARRRSGTSTTPSTAARRCSA